MNDFAVYVQPSISCRYDGKGTFDNIFRLNACKSNAGHPNWIRKSKGRWRIATQITLIATNPEAIVTWTCGHEHISMRKKLFSYYRSFNTSYSICQTTPKIAFRTRFREWSVMQKVAQREMTHMLRNDLRNVAARTCPPSLAYGWTWPRGE